MGRGMSVNFLNSGRELISWCLLVIVDDRYPLSIAPVNLGWMCGIRGVMPAISIPILIPLPRPCP